MILSLEKKRELLLLFFWQKYSESPKRNSCPPLGVRPKYRKKSSFLVIYLHYGTEAVRNGQDTNNAIRPLLEEHAKKCYLTWQYIDMNDCKLPQDDLKTFDNWKQFRLHFTICRRKLPKSNIPYDCICTEWRGNLKVPSGYQQMCKCKHAYIAALRYAKHSIPDDMQLRMTANKKRGRPSKTKSAYERQPGEMPSPEKVRKSARVEENNEEEDQVFDAPNAQDEAV